MADILTRGATLAQRFYDDHQDAFAKAIRAVDVAEKFFVLDVRDLDAWLVEQGQLDAPADSYDSNTKERRGVTLLRNTARQRINAAALRSDTFPAYAIGPNKQGKLRVRHIALYAQEAPSEIAHGITVSSRHFQRVVRRAVSVLQKSHDVSDEDRAGMIAFSRFMVPLLEGWSRGMTDAMRNSERARRRKAQSKSKRK